MEVELNTFTFNLSASFNPERTKRLHEPFFHFTSKLCVKAFWFHSPA
jgi:isocitrate lyase